MGALPYKHYLVRDTIILLVFSPAHTNDLTRPPGMATAKKEKRYPSCLAHAGIGVRYTTSLPTDVNPTYLYIKYDVYTRGGGVVLM